MRNYDFSISPSWWTDLSGDPISHEVDLKLFGIDWHDGDSFDIGIEFEGDRLMDSFSPGDGATISPGSYSWGRIEGERRWSSARPLSGSVRFGLGEWYDGHSQTASGSVTWRPSMHWGTSLRFFEGHFDLPGGDFASRSGRLSVNWSASPEFSVHNLLQTDNQSDQVGFQSRTHWLLEDGRELFFVINHGWAESANGSLIPGGQDFSLKLVWSLRS